ncbi:hypothetical protein MNL76_06050 [Fervidobacterium riparium]|uniref:Protein argonaute n=1 Tax=Fervidobacterium gondwanense DSM 13020 TaxID=1121883 RepID=A0A1M7TG74_FERGO|nr:hypothetical protein [Fervidobacterium gondwanense]UXF00251.1 hypothetical protein IB67_01240 [Fervidobacterium riparium]SHN69727.1 hypothetical protein SAMN02745226_01962 [Fervidobacterium gondwanense DSM 13020]
MGYESYGIPLNIFKIKLPPVVKRTYYFNQTTQPEIFASNLSRVNNIHFSYSNDLVWVDTPLVQVQILPLEASKYEIDKKEIIENDDRLFTKVFDAYIGKLFQDNGYLKVYSKNIFVNPRPVGSIANGEVSYYLMYLIRTLKLDEKWYLLVAPKLKFLSAKPTVESNLQSVLAFNFKTGKSFRVIEADKNQLKIFVNENIVSVKDLPAYYYSYTSTDAEKYGFLQEIIKIQKEVLPEQLKKLSTLQFLKDAIEISSQTQMANENIIQNFYEIQLKDGTSDRLNDIFKLHPIKTEGSIKIAFFFKSKEQYMKLKQTLTTLFHPNGIFTKAFKNLGIKKLSFLKNPANGSYFFTYDESTFTPSMPFKTNEKVVAIIFLEKFYGNIVPIIRNFPRNFILMPVLEKTILESKAYTINSFAYKIVNFTNERNIMYYLKIEPGTVFVGIDIAHSAMQDSSDIIFSSVDFLGKVLRVAVRKNAKLTEKADERFIESEIIKTIETYKIKYNREPKRIIIFRDGMFLEEISEIEETLKARIEEYALVEIKKNSMYNSHYNLQDKIIKLNETNYIYFPKTYQSQKSVEIKIVKNATKLKNNDIAKQTYLSTLLHHPSPYMTLKLPYPLYINDKISKVGGEWRFYVPYFI